MKLTGSQLLEDLKAGPEVVQQKYSEKPIEVTGHVSQFASGVTDRDSETPVDQIYLWETLGETRIGICCEMSEREPWQTLRPGQTVTVRGLGRRRDAEFEASGANTYLILEHARVVTAEPPTTEITTLTADVLAREFLADGEACQKKYAGHPLIVSGTLDQLRFPEDSYATMTLAAPEGVVIECETLLTPQNERWQRLKAKTAGERMKFLASDVGFDAASKKITLYGVFDLK